MGECCDSVCKKCWSMKYLIVGLILIVNQLWIKWDIWVVLGVLLVLKGVLMLAMPNGCGHCEVPVKKGKK